MKYMVWANRSRKQQQQQQMWRKPTVSNSSTSIVADDAILDAFSEFNETIFHTEFHISYSKNN